MRLARVAALLLLSAGVACGDSTAPNPASSSIAGTWRLQTMNGLPLPFVIQGGTTTIALTSDVITIADGGTWTEAQSVTIAVNGGAPQQEAFAGGGTWVRAGAQVGLVRNGSTAGYSGTFTGSALELGDGTFSYTFSR